MMLDRSSLMGLSAKEMTVLIGGMRVFELPTMEELNMVSLQIM